MRVCVRCEGVPASTGVGVKVGVCKDRGGVRLGLGGKET